MLLSSLTYAARRCLAGGRKGAVDPCFTEVYSERCRLPVHQRISHWLRRSYWVPYLDDNKHWQQRHTLDAPQPDSDFWKAVRLVGRLELFALYAKMKRTASDGCGWENMVDCLNTGYVEVNEKRRHASDVAVTRSKSVVQRCEEIVWLTELVNNQSIHDTHSKRLQNMLQFSRLWRSNAKTSRTLDTAWNWSVFTVWSDTDRLCVNARKWLSKQSATIKSGCVYG